jgi:DNA transformation protein
MPKPRTNTSSVFPGIDPVTERRLIAIGIGDLAELRKTGTVKAYQRLKFRYGRAVTLNALYGLEAVLLGCRWQHLPPARKEELRAAAAPLDRQ